MSLPKITVATFETKLPSNGKKLKYRPFLVKEEKILLMAAESKDNTQILNALQQVIENCVIDKINFDELPSFDIEYLFLKLREKSIGEKVTVNIIDTEVNKKFEIDIDLSKVIVKKHPKHEMKIKISDDIILEMKYPNMATILSIDETKSIVENGFTILTKCIEKIYDKDSVYDAKDYSQQELQDFIEQFSQKMYEHISFFFDNMPSIYYETEVVSPFTNKKIKVVMDKFVDFF
jgi:hypothetical protein